MARDYLTLSRHGTLFYFRRRVPDALRAIIGKPYLVKSLRTGNRREATILARAYAVQADCLFARLRMMTNEDLETFRIDFGFEIDLDELGKPRKITVDAEPHEVPALNSAIETALRNLPQGGAAVKPSAAALPFSEAIKQYNAKAALKSGSKATYRSRLAHAKAYFGEGADVLMIGQAEFTKYADHVIETVENIVTQGHYITTVSGFLNWHLLRAGQSLVTTKTLVPKKTTPDTDDRDAYTLDEMRVLFENARRYRDSSPHKYWVTVAAAFLGCRLEEIAQVNLHADLVHDGEADVWYFKFDELPDADGKTRKSLKKVSTWRHVPIHSALVKHGFINYLNAQKQAGASRPFERGWTPRVAETDAGSICKWSHYIGKWGGRELEKLNGNGVLRRGKLTYFHSMRHTFKAFLGESGVPSEISEALAGRRYAGADAERYEKLKRNHRRLASEGIERGLGALAGLLNDDV